eukprot:s364_g3.t1
MQDGRSIMWASGQLKQDVPLALEAVRQDGRSLQFVAEELAFLKSFRNVAVEAVKQTGDAWRFVDRNLRRDVDFAISAVQQNRDAASIIAADLDVPLRCLLSIAEQEDLRHDRNFMLEMIRESWTALRLVGSGLSSDEQLQMAAVTQSWQSVKYMVEPPIPVILAAMRQSMEAAELLTNLEDGAKAIVAMTFPTVIQIPHFGASKLTVLAAVRRDGLLLQHASRALREDQEVVDAAVRQNPEAQSLALGVARSKLEPKPSPDEMSPVAATKQASLLPWSTQDMPWW